MSCLCSAQTIGTLALLYWLVLKPARILYHWYKNRTSTRSEEILVPGANEYAVITGATDGIGLEYARQLAQRGYNLVLLSRTEEKLKNVAKEIREQYSKCKKIETLAVDFSRTDIYDRIQAKLDSLDGRIHVLVNNVGMVHPCAEHFANYPDGYNLRLINTNIVSMTLMSEIVLRLFNKQANSESGAKRPKGVIINISSAAGLMPMALMSTYSSSKVYMNYLSKILSVEYAKDNIIVQTVTPNQVDTKMAATYKDDDHPTLMVVSAKDFVENALKAVGVEQETSAHPKHKLLNQSFALLYNWLCEPLYNKLMIIFMQAQRTKYDKKFKSK